MPCIVTETFCSFVLAMLGLLAQLEVYYGSRLSLGLRISIQYML